MNEAKREVDPALLERLAKGRAIAAERRKELAAKKLQVKDPEITKVTEPVEPEEAPKEEPKAEPETPKPSKSKKKIVVSDSDSSTDSSDTSDSDAPVPMKRAKSKRSKVDLREKLEIAKEKYKARYKMRYEILAAAQKQKIAEPVAAPVTHHDSVPSGKPQAPSMQKVARQMARNSISSALNKELLESTIKNLMGL